VADKEREHDPADEAFRLHYGQIYRYLRRQTGSHHEAEELAQRVFADAAAALASKNPPNSLLAWLYAIAQRRFVDELRLGEGDRAAVVAFNADARLLAGLTADRRVLDAALGGIELAGQTCLVCGVQVAAEELLAQREAGRALVLVLLTDGQSNPRPASEAVDAAAAAKAAGVTVFTIGLGAELDEAALRAIASRPEYNYRAPDAADLEAIYRRIAVTIPCPGQTFWPNTTGQGAAGAEPAERNQR